MTIFNSRTLCVLLSLCVITPVLVHGQAVQDTLQLEPVYIEATRYSTDYRYQPVHVTRINSDEIGIFPGDNISRILEDRSFVFVRNYGMGGLSTVSLNGYSPSQSQVLWNGFSINDPMSGNVDLSLIPSEFVSRLEVSTGNSSTAYGNRSAGGTVYLDTDFRNRGLSAWQTLGSFGKNRQGLGGGWSTGSWNGTVKFQRESSDNDFRYRVDGNEEKRTHNSLEGLHGLADIGYNGETISFNSMLWLYDVENNTPGSTRFPSETAVQADRAARWLNRFRYQSGSHEGEVNLYTSRTTQTYTDDAFDIDTENNTRQTGGEIVWNYAWTQNFDLTQVVTLSTTHAETDFYDEDHSQWKAGYQLNPAWQPADRLRLFGGFRYDYYETVGDAPSASFGFNYELAEERLFVRGQASRNFVAPGLNDLYWVPSGNPDLKPETNRKAELGLMHILDHTYGSIRTNLTGFAGKQIDGIRWIESPPGSFSYVATNIDEIYSRGFELESEQTWEAGSSLGFQSMIGVKQNVATVEADQFDDDRSVGKQLVYVPEWTFKARLSANFRTVSGGITWSVTGERYTSQDHSSAIDPLDSYDLSSAYLQFTLPWQRFELKLTGRVENLFDEQYQVIGSYPMPGRHVQVTARIDFGAGN